MRVYNTMKQEKEELLPVRDGHVGIYVCGPTTYNYIHLGNARPLVVFDTVRRYLEYRGFDVTYVQNFTDVDDKIINRAREEGDDPLALSSRYIDEYFVDADALGVRRADVHPRVSQHIPEIIEVVKGLVEKGHAYAVDGDIYFRISSFPEYGKLSHRSMDEMLAGARVGVDERKEDPMDFALWKAAKPGEPSWDSPWGPGRPGWHIECSVMSMKYLGDTFDIHGGGFDLIFPHHENEIAQAEAYTGRPFARYWLHNGFITVNQEKMSKSLGNFFIVRDILAKFPAPVVRFFLISTHYRSPLDFDDSRLKEAARALARLTTSRQLMREYTGGAPAREGEGAGELAGQVSQAREEFISAMDDDFNTARAMAGLFEICRLANGYMAAHPEKTGEDRAAVARALAVFEELFAVFGIDDCAQGESDGDAGDFVALAIEVRANARKDKNWALSDRIRDDLGAFGVVLEDSKSGTRFNLEKAVDADLIIDYLVTLRRDLKKDKQYQLADFIRSGLGQLHVVVEDTREGARWHRELAE